MCARPASSPPPSSAATTGTPPSTATGCWCGWGGPFPSARAAVARSLTPANIEAEARYLNGPGRAPFERPYGLAWLLQLAAELREWDDPQAREWAATLKPLEEIAAGRIRE